MYFKKTLAAWWTADRCYLCQCDSDELGNTYPNFVSPYSFAETRSAEIDALEESEISYPRQMTIGASYLFLFVVELNCYNCIGSNSDLSELWLQTNCIAKVAFGVSSSNRRLFQCRCNTMYLFYRPSGRKKLTWPSIQPTRVGFALLHLTLCTTYTRFLFVFIGWYHTDLRMYIYLAFPLEIFVLLTLSWACNCKITCFSTLVVPFITIRYSLNNRVEDYS